MFITDETLILQYSSKSALVVALSVLL